jgi:hypothetical protein
VVDRLLRAPTDALRRGLDREVAHQGACLECLFGVAERGEES